MKNNIEYLILILTSENVFSSKRVLKIMSEFTFSSPSLDDVLELARIHVRCWKETYTELLPAEILDTYTEENRSRMWAKFIASTPEQVLLVRELDRLLHHGQEKRNHKLKYLLYICFICTKEIPRKRGWKKVSTINKQFSTKG